MKGLLCYGEVMLHLKFKFIKLQKIACFQLYVRKCFIKHLKLYSHSSNVA